MGVAPPEPQVRRIGRYMLFQAIAKGGMATVHLGRLRGPAGFARTVALKRLHTDYATDPEFVSMFLDEARLAARIQHPNVVSVFDVVAGEGELFLVMEYVHGESLARLLETARRKNLPPSMNVISHIMTGVLEGLHAAHDARGERGERLELVHRDVSPQNVLVSIDGVPRVLDFGIAKASQRLQGDTREGHVKGKLRYLAPEQVTGKVDRRTDVYAASVVLWEAITGQNFLEKGPPGDMVEQIMTRAHEAPSKRRAGVPAALDAVVAKGLARDPRSRYATAREMALALERAVPPATSREVGEWVTSLAEDQLTQRSHSIVQIESTPNPTADPLLAPADLSPESDSSVKSAKPTLPRINSPPTGSVSLATSDLHVLSSGDPSSTEQTAPRTVMDRVDRVSESAIATVVYPPTREQRESVGVGAPNVVVEPEPEKAGAKPAAPEVDDDGVVDIEMPSLVSIGTDLRAFQFQSAPPPPPETRRKRVATRVVAIALPALFVFTAGAFGVRALRSRGGATGEVVSSSVVSSVVSTSVSSSTSSSPSPSPSTSMTASARAPTSASTVTPAATALASSPPPVAPRKPPAAARPKPATPRPSACDPPYTIGSDGVRIPKPACR